MIRLPKLPTFGQIYTMPPEKVRELAKQVEDERKRREQAQKDGKR